MKMKSWFSGCVIAGALILGGLIGNANASDGLFEACMAGVKRECHSWAAKGGGGEAPRGLTRDTRVELANGETYILSGYIEFMSGEVYLGIDLHEQPWLANKVRVRNPYYRIDDAASNWRKYEGRDVTIVAVAQYDSWMEGSKRIVEIFLIPATKEPVISGLQKKHRR
jgi:hypothetical protein